MHNPAVLKTCARDTTRLSVKKGRKQGQVFQEGAPSYVLSRLTHSKEKIA